MSAITASDALPTKAKRALVGALRRPAGTQLSVSWYERQRGSNFDKWPREQIRIAAEDAGFIEYKGGHPWVTDAGYMWAMAQEL